jgi:hypothetical protein
MLHSEGMREIVDALPEGAVLPILRPILEALSPTQCAHYLRGASAAPTTPARSPSLSPSTTAVNPRSPLSLPPPPLPRPSSPFGPRLTTPDCLLCRLLNVLNASVEAAPECLALGPSLLWYPLWLLAALQQTLSSTTSEELWPGDSFHWVLLPTPSTLTPLLPLHTLPSPHPILSPTPQRCFQCGAGGHFRTDCHAYLAVPLLPPPGPHVSILVVGPSGISLRTARNSRQSTTPGMTTTSSRTRETHQDWIIELGRAGAQPLRGG